MWSSTFVAGVPVLDELRSDWAWAGANGTGVRVAIIDSGVDAAHPAVGGPLAGYVAISQSASGIQFDTRPHVDLYGHGTACAGIVRSLAPACEIYSVRVLDARLSGSSAVLSAALKWSIEHEMHVCNLSLGTTRRDFYADLHELADAAYFRNVALVTAANNTAMPSFPSTYASALSVAAHGVADPELVYYNPRPPAEFAAFGIGVRVAWAYGGRITASGNSFAAPHVSGLVARILSKHPGLTVFQLKSVLRAISANVVRCEAHPAG
jgi:subtilisin family serine protease